MCELLGMSFNEPISPNLSFRGFRNRGLLRELSFLRQDARDLGNGIQWNDERASYYTETGRREQIDQLIS